MPRSVVLRHTLPDGSHHFDWLLEPAGTAAGRDPEERVLIAWRLPRPPGQSGPQPIEAIRLPPHRRFYLDFEGPIPGNRGTVERVAEGVAEVLADSPEHFAASLALGGDSLTITITGTCRAHPTWELRIAPDRPRR